MTTREKVTVRPYTPEDAQALVDVENAESKVLGLEYRTSAEEMLSYMAEPSFDVANDSFLLESNGRIVGMGDLYFVAERARGWAGAVVHPEQQRRGFGTQMIDLTEARCMERAMAESAADAPVSIQRYASDRNTAAIRLFEARGYYPVRTFHQMRRQLDQPINAPALPGNLVLHPFDEARDARIIHEVHEETFEDHWDNSRDTFEDWEQYMLRQPNADTSLWLIAYDGDEIAGICLNRPFGEADPSMGYVSVLGVRRGWRKQGVGFALLMQSFALFQQRGFTRAGLGVDASSLTNAVALYERAGMHVHERTLAYRKMLRGEDTEVTA